MTTTPRIIYVKIHSTVCIGTVAIWSVLVLGARLSLLNPGNRTAPTIRKVINRFWLVSTYRPGCLTEKRFTYLCPRALCARTYGCNPTGTTIAMKLQYTIIVIQVPHSGRSRDYKLLGVGTSGYYYNDGVSRTEFEFVVDNNNINIFLRSLARIL